MLEQYRTHNCGNLSKNNINQVVTLSGWIHDIRVKKFAIFLDLRDSYGLTQIIIKKEDSNFNFVKSLKVESVIKVTGQVVARKTSNPKMPTGEIEIVAKEINILSSAKDIPFVINDEEKFTASEELRLEYRYLDLRRKKMFDQLKFKHQLVWSIRNFLNQETFLEIDTPCLTKSTPEGARDFLVPSRIKKTAFYALPQSPQLYKQLLMISGVDRYYQIAKCFRDEDFRADRQPEFQQLDLEMAFASQYTVMTLVEKMLANIWQDLKLSKIDFPLIKISYQEAIDNYGSDKPDLRCTCKLVSFFSQSDDLILRGFWVDDKFNDSLKKIILRIVEQHNGQNFLVYSQEKECIIFSTNSTIVLNDDQFAAIKKSFVQDSKKKLCYLTYEKNSITSAVILGAIRTFYCLDQEKQKTHQDFITNFGQYKLLWVVDWPMFELVADQLSSSHHPFTSPLEPEKILKIANNDYQQLLKVNSAAYDLVLNGYEIAGGSVRISNKVLQEKIFAILKLKQEIVDQQFGFFLKAFNYGIPPHAGIAFGLDRFVMTLTNSSSIRDSIAFPKNNSGVDLLTNAPSVVDTKQLEELGLKSLNNKK